MNASTLAQKPQGPQDISALVDLLLFEASQFTRFDQGACLISSLLWPVRIAGLANITRVDQSTPYAVWLKKLYRHLDAHQISGVVNVAKLPAELEGRKFAPSDVLFLPLDLRMGTRAGFLFLRNKPWEPDEVEQLTLWSQMAALRLAFLSRPDLTARLKRPSLRKAILLGALLVGALFPVRLSTVAPAEVVPIAPSVISSSISGVVRAVHVRANEVITQGQLLISLDDVDQRNKRDLAQRDVELTRAELRRLEQMGFLDPSQRFRLSELEAQLRIRELELERARQELQRTQIRADRDGLAIVGDALDWAGKPVQIGERIMQIADAQKTALRIFVPAPDSPVLETSQMGDVYLDSAPWQGLPFVIRHWTFEPEATPSGTIAYRAYADWAPSTTQARLGLRGSAHIKGRFVPLLAYLARRPLILLRQSLSL